MISALRALDWSVVQQLSHITSSLVWVGLLVFVGAQLLIAIPFGALYVLWRRPEPVGRHHGNQKAVVMALMSVFLTLATKTLLTFAIVRDRPFVTHPELVPLPLRVDPASFPSSHTMIVFAIAASLLFSGLRKPGWFLMAVAVLVGFSRIAAGVHYPSDVLGGILVGIAAAWYLHREASSLKSYLPNQ